MAVFTRVSEIEMSIWLKQYTLGYLRSITGIPSGIENSNFFIQTSTGEYVLTLFERLGSNELPFYLGLTTHLSKRGILCPAPIPDKQGNLFSFLNGKPAAIVPRLSGVCTFNPNRPQRKIVAENLARMHQAGKDYILKQDNPRGHAWRHWAADKVMPYLSDKQKDLLLDELVYQDRYQERIQNLPSGHIHADLFRDNVLFHNPCFSTDSPSSHQIIDGEKEASTESSQLGGFIDFYFSGWDCFIFDIAVCVNDWCLTQSTVSENNFPKTTLVDEDNEDVIDQEEINQFLLVYHQIRPLSEEEHELWTVILRAASLRFWLSRLYDFYLPRPSQMVSAHDPNHLEKILIYHRNRASSWL